MAPPSAREEAPKTNKISRPSKKITFHGRKDRRADVQQASFYAPCGKKNFSVVSNKNFEQLNIQPFIRAEKKRFTILAPEIQWAIWGGQCILYDSPCVGKCGAYFRPRGRQATHTPCAPHGVLYIYCQRRVMWWWHSVPLRCALRH